MGFVIIDTLLIIDRIRKVKTDVLLTHPFRYKPCTKLLKLTLIFLFILL
jgi:hypothetical protein